MLCPKEQLLWSGFHCLSAVGSVFPYISRIFPHNNGSPSFPAWFWEGDGTGSVQQPWFFSPNFCYLGYKHLQCR